MPANYIAPSDLKTILHSKRANIYYLEKCRVQVNAAAWNMLRAREKSHFTGISQ